MKVLGTLLVILLFVFSIYFLFFKASEDGSRPLSYSESELVDAHRSSANGSGSRFAKSAGVHSVSSVSASSGAIVREDFSSGSVGAASSAEVKFTSSLESESSNAGVNADKKVSSSLDPKRYSGHELAEISPYIRPREQMYNNSRKEAFGTFAVPADAVTDCVHGNEEIDDPKYLWTCAFLLMDRYLSENGMTNKERQAILKRVQHLYIKAASLGHVSAMNDLSILIAYSSVGRDNLYSHDEQFLQPKIESMAWFLAGEMVGGSNFLFSNGNVRVLLTEADESSIRAAEEMALFYIDFYGIPWE